MTGKGWDDWQAGKNISESVSHLLSEELHTDVTFTFPGSPLLVKGHKLLLAARSSVFERMFYGSLPEKGEKVEIIDVEPEIFQVFIKYLYTDNRKLITDENAPGLIYIAEKYQMSNLRHLSECMCYQGIDERNCLEKLDHAVRSGNTDLADGYLTDVCALGTELRDTPTRLNILLGTLEMIVGCEFIGMSELDLFRMSNDWAVRECGDMGYPVTAECKRELLSNVFSLIRFPLLTPDELARFVLPTGYLTIDEERLFLRHQCGVKHLTIPFDSRVRTGLKVDYDNSGNTVIIHCFRPRWQILGLVVKHNVALNISCKAEGAIIYGEYCCSFITGKSYICIPEIKRRRIQLTIRAMGGSPVLDSSTCPRIATDFCPEQVAPVDLGADIPCTGIIYSLGKAYITNP